MKGYALFKITPENRIKIKSIIDERDDFIRYFNKESYLKSRKWFFGMFEEKYYDLTDVNMPSGLFIMDYPKIRKHKWLDDLSDMYELIKNKDEVYLDQDYAKMFNRYTK